jgi:hypothetical protein
MTWSSARSRDALAIPVLRPDGNVVAASIPKVGRVNALAAPARRSRGVRLFEIAWQAFLSKRTEADFRAWRDQRDWTAEKYRRFDLGERIPPDWKRATT